MAADDDQRHDGRLAPGLPSRQSSRSPLRNSTSGDEGNSDTQEEQILLQDLGAYGAPEDARVGPVEPTDSQSSAAEQTRRASDIEATTFRRPSQRVRFSTDIERTSEADSGHDTLGELGDRPTSRGSRFAASGLTVGTENIPLSSHPARLSPRSAENPPRVSPGPGGSPSPAVTSPTSRSRGYSLRRSLFNRNLQQGTSPVRDTSTNPGHIAIDGSVTAKHTRSHSGSSNKNGVIEVARVSSSSREDDSASASEEADTLKKVRTSRLPGSVDQWAMKWRFVDWIMVWFESFGTAFQEHVLRIKPIPPSQDGRHIDLDVHRTEPLIDERTGKHYISNYIRSSRYSLWSFFPKQLIAQFSKLANFYFLIVAILQMIPGLSTTGTFTTFVPLMIFVGISMGKEGFDDFRRYRLDKEENNRIAWVLRPGNPDEDAPETPLNRSEPKVERPEPWAPTKWIDIQVGDVIRLDRDQPAPADIALLHAEEPNGIAYIETMALDGETNLKSKKPSIPVAKTCATIEDIISNKSIHFAVEDPNIDLYKFDGNVAVGAEKLPLTNNEVIYRGSVLRNTHEAIGLVIYTGEECKIRMNANKNPRIKAPALQAVVNRVVAVIVLFVVVLASACTIAYRFWSHDFESMSWYLEEAKVSYGPIFTSFIIMFNTMIPISLYVSLEIVKVAQMFLLNDIDMYDEDSNTPLEARTSTINEELGQVSYIFSDKTGTLTNNSMRFRKMSVAGTAWLHDTDLNEDAEGKMLLHKKRKGKKVAGRKSVADEATRMSRLSRPSNVSNSKDRTGTSPSRWKSNRRNRQYHGGRTTEMMRYMEQKPHTLFAKKTKLFILAMALCHTCLPEETEDGDISFQAASPDEVALVLAAKELGYVVVERQPNSITIRKQSVGSDEDYVDEVYEVLDVIEFSSSRKRMSIVIRLPDQRICIFCKGADSILMKRLKRSGLAEEKVTEIERRASVRKSMEAREVMRRNSEHQARKDIKRSSLSIRRPSFVGGRRSSVSGMPRSALRDSIDMWLRDRETDGGMDLRVDGNEHYSPRPSAQFGGRGSLAYSDGRLSFQTDDGEDLVEEALVVNEAQVFERCFQHLNDFATEGLRTLLYGYRYITEAEYKEWKTQYHDAITSLFNRQERIEEVAEQIEDQFELLGATAIEDKLQKGVPEAIDKLRRANIKLWMLTGDKRETALNIGHSCRLVKDYSSVITIDHEAGNVEQIITSTASDIQLGNVAHSVVVVDGQTLSVIEADPVLQSLFFDLAILADSVICCRASPKQKAFLVKAIRKRVNKSITLAIGDGANDIAMIQEAHVGIGITGKEGLQAARISDYSIAQFRFLLKLLLVHGRWNYVRVCKYTLGTFWKETLFYLTQALYQRWNGYTGTSLYEPWALSMFNTLFTSLPVIFLGIFEKDLAASTLLAVPELYTKGQLRKGFNIKLYLGWAFMGTCEAMIVYFVMYGLWGTAPITNDNGVFAMGLLTYSAAVVIISVKLQVLEIHNHSVMAVISTVLSIGGWWLWNVILSERYEIDEIYNVRDNFLIRTGRDLLWWTTLLLSIVAVILFEVAVSTVRATLFPTDVDIFQEYEQDLEIRKRFEEAAAMELQQGWDRGTKKTSVELEREAAIEAARELQVQELLDRRNNEEEVLIGKGAATASGARRSGDQMEDIDLGDGECRGSSAGPRRSLDINELFSKGFGAIRKGPDLR
ncbi:phospholipid-translocating P-type ATPase, flippase family protein [Coccidioides posadasii C735 delta SOWgp]|uniref:Phospholipid-transporting ATPase n=1 Tax=Coccidioides posadasii (strain C735) TaxID=222929 RepID=C5PCV0_COCP7|nr:phospholipid-translocating P-type ATPase, flippase family protein [Coccidioides posadasii C735 delta SOWgp]EER24911.1 phospholipid-translocating P-type ATPase, flippase family protein [Coccidioides posadasii C735 delta SOWgp]|eukprot:XP_003067056.1 phospholipid-translocating P-type ATPase, flippase family protein [Coccidioides posadasii C735 delta SOWgp]